MHSYLSPFLRIAPFMAEFGLPNYAVNSEVRCCSMGRHRAIGLSFQEHAKETHRPRSAAALSAKFPES